MHKIIKPDTVSLAHEDHLVSYTHVIQFTNLLSLQTQHYYDQLSLFNSDHKLRHYDVSFDVTIDDVKCKLHWYYMYIIFIFSLLFLY